MGSKWTLYGSAVSLLLLTPAVSAYAQKPEVQRAVQAGQVEEAVQAAQNADPASTYLAAQALIKAEQNDRAASELGKLEGSGNDWRHIAASSRSLMANDVNAAVDHARQATQADGNNPFAYYQLGIAASKAGDWGGAVGGFSRAIELKPDLAYAHYYSALAEQRQRNLSKAAEHFEAFLRLAPNAPERSAVIAIMKTLK
jgi:tetratricopeptide (TPR) repeat protein